MELRSVNSDKFEEEVSEFRKTSLDTLMTIKPKWACGIHSDKLFNFSQHPEFGELKVFNANIEELMENVEFINFKIDTLFIDDIASDSRVVSTLKRWMNDEYVDPPTLTINISNGKPLQITDGRHRFKISVFLKLDKIPVAIHESLVYKINKIVTLNEI